jgi:hypothetical protein
MFSLTDRGTRSTAAANIPRRGRKEKFPCRLREAVVGVELCAGINGGSIGSRAGVEKNLTTGYV